MKRRYRLDEASKFLTGGYIVDEEDDVLDSWFPIRKPFEKLPYNRTVNFLYNVENPNLKGVNTKRNTVTSFNDGLAPTIGGGVASTSGAPAEWFTGQPVNKSEVDRFAYDHLANDDKKIRQAYDKIYGTKEYPNPSDTLSITPRLFVAQNRYQRGTLGDNYKRILAAMAKGSAEALTKAVNDNTVIPKKVNGKRVFVPDTDRQRRVLKSIGVLYK